MARRKRNKVNKRKEKQETKNEEKSESNEITNKFEFQYEDQMIEDENFKDIFAKFDSTDIDVKQGKKELIEELKE